MTNGPSDTDRIHDTTFGVEVREAGVLPGMWQVSLRGDVDVASAPRLRRELRSLADRHAVAVVLDLAHVLFLDSSGLSAIIEGAQALEARGGALYIEGARGTVKQVLEITALLERYRHPDAR